MVDNDTDRGVCTWIAICYVRLGGDQLFPDSTNSAEDESKILNWKNMKRHKLGYKAPDSTILCTNGEMTLNTSVKAL